MYLFALKQNTALELLFFLDRVPSRLFSVEGHYVNFLFVKNVPKQLKHFIFTSTSYWEINLLILHQLLVVVATIQRSIVRFHLRLRLHPLTFAGTEPIILSESVDNRL